NMIHIPLIIRILGRPPILPGRISPNPGIYIVRFEDVVFRNPMYPMEKNGQTQIIETPGIVHSPHKFGIILTNYLSIICRDYSIVVDIFNFDKSWLGTVSCSLLSFIQLPDSIPYITKIDLNRMTNKPLVRNVIYFVSILIQFPVKRHNLVF